MTGIIHDQTKTESRDTGMSLCGGESSRPTPVRGQGGAHVRVVGSSNSSGAASCSTVSPVTRLGGIAILSSYGIQFARLVPPKCSSVRRVVHAPGGQPATQFTHAARGGRIGELRYAARLSAKFSAALLIGRSHQVYRISDKPGSDLAYPLHVQRPLCVVGFNTDEHMERACGTVLYSTGDFLEMQGAPQHECG